MRHDYLSNTPLEEVRKTYFSHIATLRFGTVPETVPSAAANGRRLTSAVRAKLCSPHYNASAMDGIAVKAADTFGASEQNGLLLPKEKYTVVDTGDPLPEGADAVIMVEDVAEKDNGDVEIHAAVRPWQNVRQVGEDICMGDMIAVTGTKVTPWLCGAFLAGGVGEVEVAKKPVFGIIPTGDEIVPPSPCPKEGEIIEFNSAVFAAMLSDMDAESRIYPIVPDKAALIEEAVRKAASECDAVLILAGSSAGRDDCTAGVIGRLGQVIFHGIAIKPGKPAVLGEVCGVPAVGLPGYPISATVVMDEIVRGLTELYYGTTKEGPVYAEAVLGKTVPSSLKYREYVRVTLGNASGELSAVPLPRGAGVITSFTKADGILEVPQDSEGYEKGETVRVRLLNSLPEIENALIITGSHDPAIDEIADLLQQKHCGFRVVSSHVGSMGAINAVRAGQAHMGAVHLLDDNGEYNRSYVEKYFPDGGAVLIKGILRVQGLMVQKGNPKHIESFADIARVRYVNRQPGSGTRVLCDRLLQENGIDKYRVDGYRNEEFTHTAVAALIGAGNADAGLGVRSAAKMYGLDFIPVKNEEYDFLIAREHINSPQVRAFLEILRSEEFAERLERLGGYELPR